MNARYDEVPVNRRFDSERSCPQNPPLRSNRRAISERRATHCTQYYRSRQEVIYAQPTPRRSKSIPSSRSNWVMDRPVIGKTASAYELEPAPTIPIGLVSQRRAIFSVGTPPQTHNTAQIRRSYIVVSARPDRPHVAHQPVNLENNKSEPEYQTPTTSTVNVTKISVASDDTGKKYAQFGGPSKLDVVRVTPIRIERRKMAMPRIIGNEEARQEYGEDRKEVLAAQFRDFAPRPGPSSKVMEENEKKLQDELKRHRENSKQLSVELAKTQEAKKALEFEKGLSEAKAQATAASRVADVIQIMRSPKTGRSVQQRITNDNPAPSYTERFIYEDIPEVADSVRIQPESPQQYTETVELRNQNSVLRTEMAHLRDALESSTILLDQMNSAVRFSKRNASPTHESLGSSISDENDLHEINAGEVNSLRHQVQIQEQTLKNKDLLLKRLESDLATAQQCNQKLNAQMGTLATNGSLVIKKEIVELKVGGIQ
ncbi:unnamed protein product, partial [Mesorhabditis spiculigera]